jgi:hypothetical protein
MYKIILLIILAATYAFSQLGTNLVIKDSCSSSNDLEYDHLLFKAFDNINFDLVEMHACNWTSIAYFENRPTSISTSTFTYDFDEVNYELLAHTSSKYNYISVESYLAEIRNTIEDEAFGFLFVEHDFLADSLSLESSSLTLLDQGLTNLSNSTSFSLTYTQQPKSVGAMQKAHLISFHESNTFESSYSPSELLYAIYFNDGNNWLKLILDSDRSNELVGFKYYSNLNSNTYTKFIKPDN